MSDEDSKRIADTNVENLGSAEDKAVRKAAAGHEPAWATAGQKAGVEVWRIEQFKVHAIPEAEYGTFNEGDSYICLRTTEDPETSKLKHDIHFFIGKDSTADEYGSAAYKTVELDDFLDQEPTQHREHQTEDGGVSDEFKAMFPNGITYKEGGVVSGFRHVVPDKYPAKLYQIRVVKGKMSQIKCPCETRKLNSGDCFVLDTQDKIYVLDGPQSSAMEKREANLKAENMENDKQTATHDIDDAFWACLEGEKPAWAVESGGGYKAAAAPAPAAAAPSGGGGGGTHSLETLQNGCPDGVDAAHKQDALSDGDFQTTFGMSKADFGALPGWKQNEAKKKHNLF